MPDDSAYAPFSIARHEDGTRIELGRGAMGITYRATDTQLGRTVALKVINATYLNNETARQRFFAEARAAAQLHHPNVAGVFQLRSEGEDVFYAMEFVEGETIESYVKRRGPLPPRLALRIILQASQGLGAADQRGLIHRDIKPANLMLAKAPAPAAEGIEHEEDDGLLVKVIDFGLAKNVVEKEAGGNLTGGGLVGTPYYMSPEQISPDADIPLDCRSDIYSLGVTLWFLLTGRATFEGSQFQVLSQHLQKRPPLEKLTDAGVPPEIVALLGSMLAKDREERPANHPALMATLKKILRGGGSTTAARIAAADSSPDATLAISDRSPGSSASLRPASAMPLESIAPLETAGTAKRWAIPVGVGVLAAAALAIWQPWRTANKQPLAAVDAPAPVLAASPAKVEIAPEKSVAVLAFENLSDDKSNEYFSDGISEELLTVLQKIPGLRVAARTSAFSFKGKNAKAQEIGQQLGVAQLVEGSVRKAGNSVRIAARLTRADTGEQLWSENYTRDIKDVFAVQSEIAQTILEQLRARLGGEVGTSAAKAQIQSQVKAAEKGGTTNLDAYQYFLRGRFLANQFSSESLKAAIASFRKAVAADPGFALGWAALSETLSLQVGWDATMDSPISDTMEQAREAANRALAIEPNLAEALLALAQVQVEHDFNWKGGNASVRRALELVPSSARGINLLAEIEISVGSPERAIELGAQAVALDPLNPELRLSHGWHLVDVQKFAEAEAQFRRALQINPSALAVQSELALAVLWQNRAGEALAIAESDLPGWARAYALAVIYWQQGKRAEADAALEDLKTNYSQAAAFQVAQVYAYRGEPDQAFAWIERAYVQRDSGIVGLKADHMLQSLHGDPRWAALLQKLDVPAGKSK